jgi:hypothetical protein
MFLFSSYPRSRVTRPEEHRERRTENATSPLLSLTNCLFSTKAFSFSGRSTCFDHGKLIIVSTFSEPFNNPVVIFLQLSGPSTSLHLEKIQIKKAHLDLGKKPRKVSPAVDFNRL